MKFLFWILRRWYFWIFVCICLLTVWTVTWYYGDSDLRAVDAQARTLGVPTSWTELGLKVSSQDRRDKLQEIFRLQGNLKSYNETQDSSAHKTFAPPSPALIAIHKILNPSGVQRLLTAITDLGSDPLILRDSFSFSTSMPEIDQSWKIMHFLKERALVVSAPETATICHLALQFAKSSQFNSLIGCVVQHQLVKIANNMITEHFDAVTQYRPGISKELNRVADHLESRLVQVMIEEFLTCRELVVSPSLTTQADLFSAVGARLGRKIILSLELQIIDICLTQKSDREKWFDFQKLEEKVKTQYNVQWLPHHKLVYTLFPYTSNTKRNIMKNILHARLLAAEIQGKPWPLDVFHPNNAPLHRVERDGIFVGAYSVGENGIDDGGETKSKDDIYFPIRGPQKPLSATKAKLAQ